MAQFRKREDSESSEIHNLCRLCLSEQCRLIDVFSFKNLNNDESLLFPDKILDSTSIEIKLHDKLSTRICNECCEQVERIYSFRQMCRSSESLLRKRIPLDVQEKVHSSSEHNSALSELNTCVNKDSSVSDCEIEIVSSRCVVQEHISDGGLRFDPDILDVVIKEEITEKLNVNVCSESSKQEKVSRRSQNLNQKSDFSCTKNVKKLQSSSNKSNYSCQLCGKIFCHKYSLNRHKWSHSKSVYTCRNCNKIFTNNESRLRHERMHWHEKRYQCHLCDKSYVSSTSHAAHVRKHTGERPFKCAECGDTFYLISSYERHVAKHRGVREIECEICSASFWVADDLRAHVNRVH